MTWKSYFFPEEITRFISKINGEILIVEFFGKKSIVVAGLEQTGGTITGMWEKTMSVVSCRLSVVRKCLVLGLGGGDVIRSLNKYYPGVKITCIEIDPAMKEIYEKYFLRQSSFTSSFLRKQESRSKFNLQIIIAEAFKWINSSKNKKFDLIVVDLYIGKNNPKTAGTSAFLKKIKKLLNPNGKIIYNRHYSESDDSAYQKFLNLCRTVFPVVSEIVKYKYCRILILTTSSKGRSAFGRDN